MDYYLIISCISGETMCYKGTKKGALGFLLNHDHEGSGLYLEYKSKCLCNPEFIYKTLGHKH